MVTLTAASRLRNGDRARVSKRTLTSLVSFTALVRSLQIFQNDFDHRFQNVSIQTNNKRLYIRKHLFRVSAIN